MFAMSAAGRLERSRAGAAAASGTVASSGAWRARLPLRSERASVSAPRSRLACASLGGGASRRLRASLAFALLVFSVSHSAAAAQVTHDAFVQQPRAFGYVLGDVLTQRVLLEDGGRAFVPDELPATGPAGNWVERHAVRVERDTAGHRWLTVDYQIMNSPQTLTPVVLPMMKLASKASGVELRVPDWSITVAPLTPRQPVARAGLGDLRPDRRAALVNVAPLERWLGTWVAALLICVAAWIGWWLWRNWRASSAQPFARALRELRDVDESSSQAWLALHRAFDGTAGRVVQPGAVGVLFERAPQLAPERSAIEQFFAQSAERFFAVDANAATLASGATARAPLSIRALCLALRRIEKRHEP
jgi:mxaA protein